MYIPKEIKVRIAFRETTWNSDKRQLEPIDENEEGPHLAYITYCDEKGKLRKETSWNGWGQKYLGDFINTPKSGFKLEAAVTRSRDWFGSGRTMFRIIHPEGFIFEITANNLKEIITSCDLNKGTINDNCILAWDGANLALVPCSTDEYKEYHDTTEKIESGCIKPSNLTIGVAYKDRNGVYRGHYFGKHYKVILEPSEYYKDTKLSDYSSHSGKHYRVVLKIKQYHIFKHIDTDYIESVVTPKVYLCESQTSIDINNYKLEDARYSDPIIPIEVVKSNNTDIISWCLDNRNIQYSIFYFEDALIKYTVQV